MTDTDLINKITTTAMQELNEHGSTVVLGDFHYSTSALVYMIKEGFPRQLIQKQCAQLILTTWELALNSSESPNDILKAIESRINGD